MSGYQAAGGGGAGLLQYAEANGNLGDILVTSAAWADLDVSVTMTTGAHRCLVIANISAYSPTNAIGITLLIDGVNMGGADWGFMFVSVNSDACSFSFLTPVLSAGSHVFKLQGKTSVSPGVGKLMGMPTTLRRLSVAETGLTT